MTDHPPFAAASIPPVWERCDRCEAALGAGQRYCVVCGTRSPYSDDPALRYLASARRTTEQAAPSRAPSRGGGAGLAVVLALVPVAAALGVLVGRGQGDADKIVEALKAQRAPVVQISAGATAPASATPVSTTAAATTPSSTKAKAKAASAKKGGTTKDPEVLATGPAGDAHKLEGSSVSKEQLDESAKAVQRINSAKGKDYVETQRDLPDQVVIP